MVKLRIREILKQRGITQAELARRLGVTPITVNGWATGRRLPSLEILDRIAEITSTPITQFFVPDRRLHSFPEASNKQQPIINQLIRNTLMKKLLLLLLMVVSTAVGSWAQTEAEETPLYTCLFGRSYTTADNYNQSYEKTWSITNNGFTWTIQNFNNNLSDKNCTWTFIRCGRKTNKNVEYPSIANITTSAAIPEVIGTVELNISTLTTANAAYVNSITLITSETEDFTNGKSVDIPKEAGVHKISVPEPAANLYYQIKVDCKSGTSNGFVEVTSVKYYEKKEEVDKSQPATKIDFSLDEDVTYTEVQTLELSTDGRDKDGNMLPIHYLISNDGFADETSPVYTEPIIVDKSMTVSAWVSDGTNVVEDVKAYKVEIPAQVPATPVANYNGVEVGEEVAVYYGEKITISSLMADKLEIAKNDEAPVTVANPYDLEILENGVMYSVYGVNEEGKSGDYLLFEVTINKPEAPVVKFGETTVSESGEFTVQKGTVVSVAPGKGSNEVVVTDGEKNIVELTEDGTFTLSEKGEYMYTVTSKSPVEGVVDESLLITFNVVNTQNKVAIFDFTSEEGAYGMTIRSGNDQKFEEEVKSISNIGVTAIFDGRYRIWKNTPNELRLAKETTKEQPGIITFVVPSNCLIQKITIKGKVVNGLICDTSGATLTVESTTKNDQVTSITSINGLDEIVIKANKDAVQQINTITVEYVSDETENPVAPVVAIDPDATGYSDAKFNITADKGLHIMYSYEHRVPSAKMSVASADEPSWTTVEHYNHTITPSTHVATLNPGETVRYAFMAYNPDTQAKSPVVYKAVKSDGSLSGVEDVEVESGVEAEYFNLQGVRVAAPLAPGLYIERRGDKAVKVRIN